MTGGVQSAVVVNERVFRAFDAAGASFRSKRFEAALRGLLEPSILRSFRSGLTRRTDAWAALLAGSEDVGRGAADWPTTGFSRAPVPFSCPEAWIEWCLTEAAPPPLCCPLGDRLFSTAEEQGLLRGSLLEHIGNARQNGIVARTLAGLH